ncbi:MAG: molybdopterin-dependent oxidoreductase [Deltaproteobacteria bacterium]|nr:molybdopterin-dependent oxidoreductase [Deltaproteobacteria bacterium]
MTHPSNETEDPRIAYRTCPFCEATCGLEITIQGGRAVGVKGDARDVFSSGYLCPKGEALAHLHYDPDRLHKPLIKRNGDWAEVEWNEAFAAVESGLIPLMETYGRDAVGVYAGNPCAHTMAGTLCLRPMFKALRSRNIFSASTVDQIPKHVSSGLMFGHPGTIPVPDIDRTHFLLILGADPMASNGSLATAPDWPGRLRALKGRGGRLVVVDPRASRTAKLAHEHLPIKPGGDAFLLMALVWVLFEEDRVDPGRLAEHVSGLDIVHKLCRPFSPKAVEKRTGIDAATVRRIARELDSAPSAAVYGRMGTCTVEFGTLTSWLVDVLNILTGNLDRPGGAMFPTPAHMPPHNLSGGKGWTVGRWKSRVKGLPEVMGELPVCTLCDEIETPGQGQVRALITVASNPVIALPNSSRVDRALSGLDFMVSVDFYINASTRHADVILPPTGPLSTAQYDVAFYNLSVRNIANYSSPVLPKPDNEMDKWEILYRLAMIFSAQGASADAGQMDDVIIHMMVDGLAKKEGTPYSGKQMQMLHAMKDLRGPDRMLDFMLRTGAYGDGFGQNPDGLTLSKLKDHPHGIDLGPLTSRIPGVLRTTSGKIDLAPDPMVQDVQRLVEAIHRPGPGGLVLVGRRHLRTNNSWMANIPSLVSGPPRCVLHVHPEDAARLGLKDGETAEVKSRMGRMAVPVEITPDIRPGVVSLPHGWGHDLPGVRMGVARAHGGLNSNILSDDASFDPLSGNATLNGIPVEVLPRGIQKDAKRPGPA